MLQRNLIPHLIHEQFQRGIHSGTFQAATLFVDISGFTPLTESLMQHLRDGAEVLSEALGAIFGPLVSQVYARGGLIPLFAGDAFTAIFPHDPAATPDAPRHALQTAFFIQRFFTPEGRDRVFHTRYGDFAIGAKVGLSHGPVRWGIPGQAGRFSFYFRGPAVDGCALAEQQAAEGQIVADDRILPFIQEHVTAQALPGTACHRLATCSLALPAPGVALPSSSRADLAPFLPDAVLDFRAKAEFREVCPLFLSFEEPGEEAILHRFLAAAITLADTYGGTFSQIDFGDMGGIVVLWFGAPLAYENNVARAAEFLLALRSQDWPLRWRAGLAFGTVWAGIRGGVERCEYGLIGDVVNLACRLVLKAGWGEMWASPAAWECLRDAYHLQALGTFQLKGKRGETAVYRLQGRRERVEATFHAGQMVGREAELEQLVACVAPIFAVRSAACQSGRQSGLVYVYGEAGIGKSRLVHELRRRLTERGVRWFLCPADQILRQSLNPFRSLLRRYFDQSHERTVEQNRARFDAILDALIASLQTADAPQGISASQLAGELERTRSFLGALVDLHWADSLYEQLDPRLRFENTLVAFKTLVLAESLRQPVVLQLEDLHWLDADSPELVRLLVRNVAAYPFAIICTSRYRDDGERVTLAVDPGTPQQVLELGTLPPKGLRAMAVQMLEGEITDELAAFLVEKTGGNPFFVEQLVLDLRERGAVVRGADGPWVASSGGVAEVPTTIGAVLIARLDRLVAQVREVVQAAAVLGREFEVQVLSRMLQGEEEVPARVGQAEAERIWTALSEVRYIFRHALLRDAAYDMQLRARLRELHALSGAAIEGVYAADLAPHYADLAYHYGRAGDVEQERYYARLAGEQAAAQYANAQAVAYLSRALALTPKADLAGRYALLLARERVYDLQGARAAQNQDLHTLRELADALDDDERRGQVVLQRARYADATGDYPTAAIAAREMIRLGHAIQDVGLEAAGRRQWARALWRQGNLDAARPQLQETLEMARSASLRRLEIESLGDLGIISGQQGAYAEARVFFRQSLCIVREMGDQRGEGMILNNLGILCKQQGDHAGARAYYQQALESARQIGYRRGEGSALANLGNSLHEVGEARRAIDCHQQALEIARDIGDRRMEAIALGSLGNCLRDLGEAWRAIDCHQQALEIVRDIGDRRGEGNTLNNLGNAYAALGEARRAIDCHQQALHILRELGDQRRESEGLYYLSLLCHHRGDDEAACEYGQQALHIAQDLGDRSSQGYALNHLGHALVGLGHLAEAADAYQQALDIRRELGELNLATESLAGLASVSLIHDEPALVLTHVEEILSYLETNTLDGTCEPLWIYLTCYQVLEANQDPRAQDVLTTAYCLLQEQAAKIEDEETRRSFLENVAAHREIFAAYRAWRRAQ